MARNVYVTALEPGTGKSAVILGLTEMLSRRAGRLGFFRPLIASAAERDADLELMLDRFRLPQEYDRSYALTLDDLHDVTDRTGYTRLLERVLTAYRTLADGDAFPRAPVIGEGVTATAVADAAATAAAEVVEPDVVVVEGSDFTAGSLAVELDFNVDAANHLGAPVLLVVRGRRRTADQVLDSVASGLTTLRDHGCTLIGVVANRVDPASIDEVRAGMPGIVGDDLVAAALPEAPILAAPTVAEVARALGAQYLQPANGTLGAGRRAAPRGGPAGRRRDGPGRTSSSGSRDGDLVITPGDRADIVAGSLAAHLSGTYPAVAGLVLTGGLIPPAVHRLVDGYGHVGIPVIAAGDDTYTVTSAVTAVRGSITARSPRKIATAVAGFEDGVDTSALLERITQARPTRTTPLMFEHALIERARADRRHIVLPEGNDDRILTAADQLLQRRVVDLTVLGDRARRPRPAPRRSA